MFHHPDARRWALHQNAADTIIEKILKERSKTYQQISLVALMAWMWRDNNITSLDSGFSISSRRSVSAHLQENAVLFRAEMA